MDDKIFILDNNGQLSELVESRYDSEDLLQKLLSDYTELLAGSQIDELDPRSWLLISREMGIADKAFAGNRWSVDHLFIDQDAIPTLVEVKRSTDTRIRREVVGQILDYAANATQYWSVEQIMSTYYAQCKSKQLDPEQELINLIGEDRNPDDFWNEVETNLQAGKIRMLIVADIIPYELKTVIEFLNNQMSPAQILGIEIKQFKNDSLKTLVPKVIGKTSQSDAKKKIRRTSVNEIDEETFWKVFLQQTNRTLLDTAQDIISRLAEHKDYIYLGGSGIEHGLGHSYLPVTNGRFGGKRRQIHPFGIWTSGSMEIHLQRLRNRGKFDLAINQQIIIDRLNQIPGVEIGSEKIYKRPNFQISLLTPIKSRQLFIDTMKWVYEELMKENELTNKID